MTGRGEWGWARRSNAGRMRSGVDWVRPFVAAVPWVTLGVLLLMLHLISGTLTRAEGVLFDLPEAGMRDGVATKLVALVLPVPRETLVFFDDTRYVLGDDQSASALESALSDRSSKLSETAILVLADRRVAVGELMKFAGIARRSGLKSILFAEKRDEGEAE